MLHVFFIRGLIYSHFSVQVYVCEPFINPVPMLRLNIWNLEVIRTGAKRATQVLRTTTLLATAHSTTTFLKIQAAATALAYPTTMVLWSTPRSTAEQHWIAQSATTVQLLPSQPLVSLMNTGSLTVTQPTPSHKTAAPPSQRIHRLVLPSPGLLA